MKKTVGVLGCGGAVGKEVIRHLSEKYSILGGQRSFCEFENKNVKWIKTDIPAQNIVPPAPVREIIDLSGAANPLQQAVWESYNPFDDDLRLRKSPETFEMQRGLYPLRREFPAYYIKGIPPTGSPILENLGFHLV